MAKSPAKRGEDAQDPKARQVPHGGCGMKLLPNHTSGPGPSGSPKGGADAVLVEYSGCTNAGKARPNNEDALVAGTGRDERLFVVADGMGGH